MKEGLSKVIDTLNETSDQQKNLGDFFAQIDHLEKVINELEKKGIFKLQLTISFPFLLIRIILIKYSISNRFLF